MSLLVNQLKPFTVTATGVIQKISEVELKVLTADFHIVGGSGFVEMGLSNLQTDLLPAYSFTGEEVKSLSNTGIFWDLNKVYFKATSGLILRVFPVIKNIE